RALFSGSALAASASPRPVQNPLAHPPPSPASDRPFRAVLPSFQMTPCPFEYRNSAVNPSICPPARLCLPPPPIQKAPEPLRLGSRQPWPSGSGVPAGECVSFFSLV